MIKIKNKAKIIVIICYWISVLIIFSLPIKLVIENNFSVRYTEGPSVIFTYALSSLIVIIMLYCMIRNFKNLKSKKYLPLFVFLVVGAGSMYFQMLNPGLLLITSVETYIILLMYFTIENPDMKMIEEIIKNKNIADNNNEKKTFFIYDIVQNLRRPLSNIRKVIKDYNSNYIDINNCLNEVVQETTKADLIINDTLDISNLSSEKIFVYKDNYDLKIMIKQLQVKYKNLISKDVNFIVNVSNDVPNHLYGDVVRLKQIINSILDNSLKYTKKGFIELTIYPIIKRDVCRLLITIEDSGIGMTIEQTNSILEENNISKHNEELDQSDASLFATKKLVNYIGGTMLLESEKNVGTKVTIILDQRMPEITDNFEYTYIVNGSKNIYILDDNWESIQSKIDKTLYENNIKADYCKHGVEILQKIRNREIFDLIVINDNINGTSCKEILEKIVNVEKYVGKILVICPKSKQHIYSKYKLDGLLNDDFKYKDLVNKITKHLH